MTLTIHPLLIAAAMVMISAWQLLKLRRPASPLPTTEKAAKANKQRYKYVDKPDPSKGRFITHHGYVRVMDPTHPLAGKTGYVTEHRKVLYDAIGEGDHSCHWCGKLVRWGANLMSQPDYLVVDHQDGDRQNNAVKNLRPSCVACNSVRTGPKEPVKQPRSARSGAERQRAHRARKAARKEAGLCMHDGCESAPEVGPRCAAHHKEYQRIRKAEYRRSASGAAAGVLSEPTI